MITFAWAGTCYKAQKSAFDSCNCQF